MKKRIIMTILLCCLWAGNAWGGEYWVDNSIELTITSVDETTHEITETVLPEGKGAKDDPFSKIKSLEAVVTPGSVHTINLIGTDTPYEGGLGGHGLKKWIFWGCVIVKHEDAGKVLFYSTRTIPSSALSGLTSVKTLHVNNKFRADNYRFVRDGTDLKLIRPDRLGEKQDDGFSYDAATSQLTINTITVPTVSDVSATKTVEVSK